MAHTWKPSATPRTIIDRATALIPTNPPQSQLSAEPFRHSIDLQLHAGAPTVNPPCATMPSTLVDRPAPYRGQFDPHTYPPTRTIATTWQHPAHAEPARVDRPAPLPGPDRSAYIPTTASKWQPCSTAFTTHASPRRPHRHTTGLLAHAPEQQAHRARLTTQITNDVLAHVHRRGTKSVLASGKHFHVYAILATGPNPDKWISALADVDYCTSTRPPIMLLGDPKLPDATNWSMMKTCSVTSIIYIPPTQRHTALHHTPSEYPSALPPHAGRR